MTVMKPTLERDLAEIGQIVSGGLNGHPARVYLFGSRADGTAREHSDIDVGRGVAVSPLAEPPVGTSAPIREALEETTIPYTVDLVLRDTDEAFRARVLAEGTPWREPANG